MTGPIRGAEPDVMADELTATLPQAPASQRTPVAVAPGAPASPATPVSVTRELVGRRCRELTTLLGSNRRHDPELVRIWGQLATDLDAIDRVLSTDVGYRADADHALGFLASDWPDDRGWSLPQARELRNTARAALSGLGGRHYTAAVLDTKDLAREWRETFGDDEIDLFRGRYRDGSITPDEHRRVVERLVVLSRNRARKRRKSHAQLAVRGRHLRAAVVVLLVATGVGATGTALAAGQGPSTIVIALGAGALGSSLSGARDVRALNRLTELRSFGVGLFAIPVAGAAAGLVVLLFLTSGVVRLPGMPQAGNPSGAAIGLYAFVAGFSEPFLLGIVARITGIKDAEQKDE